MLPDRLFVVQQDLQSKLPAVSQTDPAGTGFQLAPVAAGLYNSIDTLVPNAAGDRIAGTSSLTDPQGIDSHADPIAVRLCCRCGNGSTAALHLLGNVMQKLFPMPLIVGIRPAAAGRNKPFGTDLSCHVVVSYHPAVLRIQMIFLAQPGSQFHQTGVGFSREVACPVRMAALHTDRIRICFICAPAGFLVGNTAQNFPLQPDNIVAGNGTAGGVKVVPVCHGGAVGICDPVHGNGDGAASMCLGAVVGEVGVLYLHSDHSCSDGLSGCALRLSRLTAFFHAAGRGMPMRPAFSVSERASLAQKPMMTALRRK